TGLTPSRFGRVAVTNRSSGDCVSRRPMRSTLFLAPCGFGRLTTIVQGGTRMPSIEPSPEKLQKLVAEAHDESPIVMINLLRYRDRAEYPQGSDETPCSGEEAYQRYAQLVLPMVGEVGGKVVWRGSVKHVVIGPGGEEWDEALLVQYSSRRAF